MMTKLLNQIIVVKNSSEFKNLKLTEDLTLNLKSYFENINIRYKSGEEFPYDLEELIPIVYSKKENAVRALDDLGFINGLDFVASLQQRSITNTRNSEVTEYLLSPLAFEFLVARKNKEIFKIYYEIYHFAFNNSNPVQNALSKVIESVQELNSVVVNKVNTLDSIVNRTSQNIYSAMLTIKEEQKELKQETGLLKKIINSILTVIPSWKFSLTSTKEVVNKPTRQLPLPKGRGL